jgi:hypothetical protein
MQLCSESCALKSEAIGCAELKPREDFFFLLDHDKQLPAFVYVTFVDKIKQGVLKLSLVSPSSGGTK